VFEPRRPQPEVPESGRDDQPEEPVLDEPRGSEKERDHGKKGPEKAPGQQKKNERKKKPK
jgi:hypothetical protein